VTPLSVDLPEEALQAIAERVVGMLQACSSTHEDGRWPEWMSVETAARYLDVSPERVRKLQARGQLPYYQEGPGCRVFFHRRELDSAMSVLRAA
jgi:excisionase family DNA binding protein